MLRADGITYDMNGIAKARVCILIQGIQDLRKYRKWLVRFSMCLSDVFGTNFDLNTDAQMLL